MFRHASLLGKWFLPDTVGGSLNVINQAAREGHRLPADGIASFRMHTQQSQRARVKAWLCVSVPVITETPSAPRVLILEGIMEHEATKAPGKLLIQTSHFKRNKRAGTLSDLLKVKSLPSDLLPSWGVI